MASNEFSAESAEAEMAARDVVRSYNQAYERRAQKSENGAAFAAAEANVLVAIYDVEQAEIGTSYDRGKALDSLTRHTRNVLEKQPDHSPATDTAGYALARAYGVLPLRRPPLEDLEWVLQSGLTAGAVTGLTGSAWRALFLAEAMSSFNWEHLPTAQAQLARWVPYAESKLSGFGAAGAEGSSVSQLARTAFVLTELGRTLGRTALAEASEKALSRIVATQREDGAVPATTATAEPAPTAVIAQFVVAAQAAGITGPANRARAFLLTHRCDREKDLLLTGEEEGRYELSPWVPLALLGASPGPVKQAPAMPRSMRNIFRRRA